MTLVSKLLAETCWRKGRFEGKERGGEVTWGRSPHSFQHRLAPRVLQKALDFLTAEACLHQHSLRIQLDIKEPEACEGGRWATQAERERKKRDVENG